MKYKLKISSNLLDHNSIISQYNEDSLPYCKKPIIKDSIYQAIKGEIKAETIIENIFPDEKPHIFISHSHKDEKVATRFANFIYENFGIISFIDSMFWNHLKDPTRQLHEKYCKIKGSSSYNYDTSNKLLEHMHSMLSISLLNVMHNSDCVLFIDSENSVYPSSVSYPPEYSDNITISPWIFNEISYANILKEKRHHEIEKLLTSIKEELTHKRISKSKETLIINEGLENYTLPKILHKIDFTQFIEIDEAKLQKIVSLRSNCLKKYSYSAAVNLTLMYALMEFYEDDILTLVKNCQ